MRKLKLHTKILIGLLLGIVIGLIFREKAMVIRPIGTIFIRLISMVVVPLVLVSLMLGTASLGDIKKLGRIGLKTILYFMVTTVIAISIGLILANVVKPGLGLNEEIKKEIYKDYSSNAQMGLERLKEKPSTIEVLVDIIPSNPFKSLIEGNMLQVIFIALIFGIALTMIQREKAVPLINFFEGVNDAVIQIVYIAMKLAPFGVCALIAVVVGQFGVHILITLLKYSLLVIFGLLIHLFLVNSLFIRFLGRANPLRFFKGCKEALLIAFSTSSSNAALPVAMECVQKQGVSREFSSFVIPLGATINMDGTALYQGISAVFIAQIYGMQLSIGDQLTIVLMATLASVGTAGVPSSGIITLVMVLKQIGIPMEGLALILGVERILDMCRTATNTAGNMTSSLVVQALEKKRNKDSPH
ncbi:MAG: dicarboxylate/amino acid:cation symporter [Candidatus Aminicenantales bacterium]